MTAIVASDIQTRFTTTAGAAGDSTAGTAAGSLGKYASTTSWAGGVLHDLFDPISGAENAASTADYRVIGVLNNNASNPWETVKAYLSAETAGGASLALGADTNAASPKGQAGAQFVQIANETTAPAGVTFTSPTTYAAGVDLGTIPVANVKGLHIRRTAANSAALSNDGGTLAIQGDTGGL
jgi:hypothetical protein